MLPILSSFGPFVRQYIIVIIANLSLYTSGLGVGWTSPVIVKLQDENNPVYEKPITDNEASLIVSLGLIGGITANVVAAYLVDNLGRKKSILLAAAPRIFCYTLSYFSVAPWMNYVARIVGGTGDGLSFCIVPMYASEIASKEIRGALGTMFQIFSSLGILTMLSVGPFLDYYTVNIVCIVLCVVTTIPMLIIPDSPYFLHKQGNVEEAVNVLTFLRASESEVKGEVQEYENDKGVTNMTFRELFKTSNLPILKIVGIAVCIGVGSQITGYNAIAMFLQAILVSTKTSVSPEIASVIIGVIQLLASFFTASIIDRFGRKPILSISVIGISVGMIGLGTFFFKTSESDVVDGFWNYLPLVSIVIAVFSYSAGLGSLMFPLIAELFDGRSRALGMFFGVVSVFVATFILTLSFTSLANAIGAAYTYWFFGVNCLIFFVFIVLFVPETKGKTFAEIQVLLGVRPAESNKDVEKF